jgi:hypothetical protein
VPTFGGKSAKDAKMNLMSRTRLGLVLNKLSKIGLEYWTGQGRMEDYKTFTLNHFF